MNDFISKAIAEKLIVVSSRNRITMKQNKDGEWKKDCDAVFSGVGLSHKKIKNQMYKQNGKTHFVRTGKDSGVIGLLYQRLSTTLDQNVALLIGLWQINELGICKKHLMHITLS